MGLDHIYFFFGFFTGFAGGRPLVEPYVPLPCGISYSPTGIKAFSEFASLAASIDTCNAASVMRIVARAASAASLSAGMVALMSRGAKAAFRDARLASCAMTFALSMLMLTGIIYLLCNVVVL
mgnify:CR=1 FL=1